MTTPTHRLYITIVLLVGNASLYAQDYSAVRKELEYMYDRDQKCRTGKDSAQYASYIDSTNLLRTEAILNKYGWLGRQQVGKKANVALFTLVQHAPLEVELKYLPLFRKSVADSASRPCDLALMEDRVLMYQGKPQIYGSQVVRSHQTGNWELHPIEDEKNVNKRRAAMGLEPIEEYAEFFGIKYKAPKN